MAANDFGSACRGRYLGRDDVAGQSVSLPRQRIFAAGFGDDGVARAPKIRTRLALVGVRVLAGCRDPGHVRLVREEEKRNGPSAWATAAMGLVKILVQPFLAIDQDDRQSCAQPDQVRGSAIQLRS